MFIQRAALAVCFVSTLALQSRARSQDVVSVLLGRPVTIYCLSQKTLKLKKISVLPARSSVVYVPPLRTSLYDREEGTRETGGFHARLAVPGLEFPTSCVAEEGWIASVIDVEAGPFAGIMPPIQEEASGDGRFVEYYEETGRPRPSKMGSFIDRVSKRFSVSWNKRVEFEEINSRPYYDFKLTKGERLKWSKIYRELATFADRTRSFDLKYLHIGNPVRADDLKEARDWSIRGEATYGTNHDRGAWDIAVIGTAERKGFGPTPCAEFASEVIRQAYVRAGYDFTLDFLPGLHTKLVVTFDKNTWGPQSVRGLGDRLIKAGWIPWDPTRFRPPVGAIGMHGDATTPGHTYVMGGSDGRIIVDNGNPNGLDLRGTEKIHKTNFIPRQYAHSVFFLPPGIHPDPW